MGDILITALDDEVISLLAERARSQGITLEQLAARILDHASTALDARYIRILADEVAAMRATQPRQAGDAVADIRALRDGDGGEPAANRAA